MTRVQDTRCEGYANYETFTVAVLLQNNSRELYEKWRKRAKELKALFPEKQFPDAYSDACIRLSDEIKEWVEGNAPTIRDRTGLGLYQQLLAAAMDKVDWREVAEDFLTD